MTDQLFQEFANKMKEYLKSRSEKISQFAIECELMTGMPKEKTMEVLVTLYEQLFLEQEVKK